MTGLSIEELKQLPDGSELCWVFSAGTRAARHKAVVKKRVNESLLLHVFFDGSTPEARRWSLVTNQPLNESRGYTGGKVSLEAIVTG